MILADPPTDQNDNPYEGSITIDTDLKRYLISVKLEGFRVDDMTIAVKSVSPSSSNASRSSISSQASMTSDSASARSFALGRVEQDAAAAASQMGRRGSVVGEGGSYSESPGSSYAMSDWARGGGPGFDRPVQAKGRPGKVLHLLADRWDDAAHFERRITFGVDADFSGGVSAKYDGSVLQIEVPRRAAKPQRDRLYAASPPPAMAGDTPRYDASGADYLDGMGKASAAAAAALAGNRAASSAHRRTSEWDAGREERHAAAKMTDWQAHSERHDA